MNTLEFIHVAGPFRDETTYYQLKLKHPLTVDEFMQEVLSRNEWGYVDIGDRRIEYKHDKVISGTWDDIGHYDVIPKEAYGGWTRMDYKITIQ